MKQARITYAGRFGRATVSQDGKLYRVELLTGMDWYATRSDACRAALAVAHWGVVPVQLARLRTGRVWS